MLQGMSESGKDFGEDPSGHWRAISQISMGMEPFVPPSMSAA
jgi:hypothetical protein